MTSNQETPKSLSALMSQLRETIQERIETELPNTQDVGVKTQESHNISLYAGVWILKP